MGSIEDISNPNLVNSDMFEKREKSPKEVGREAGRVVADIWEAENEMLSLVGSKIHKPQRRNFDEAARKAFDKAVIIARCET
ncbi:MAG: hypothetical protein EOM37_05065 [Proteobacteria bacterium]|nr:hypothetical protein [Pseudomonadota bacterium]